MNTTKTYTAKQIDRNIMHAIVSTALPQMVQHFCEEVNLNPQKRYASYFARKTQQGYFGGFFGNERKIPVKCSFIPMIKDSENPSRDYFEANKQLLFPPDKVIAINVPFEEYIKLRYPAVPYYKAIHAPRWGWDEIDELPRNLPELLGVSFKLILKRGTGAVKDYVAVTTQFNNDGTVRYGFREDDLTKLTNLFLEKEPRSFEIVLSYALDDTVEEN